MNKYLKFLIFVTIFTIALILVNVFTNIFINKPVNYEAEEQTCWLNETGKECERNSTEEILINGTIIELKHLTKEILREHCECIVAERLGDCLEWRCKNLFIKTS